MELIQWLWFFQITELREWKRYKNNEANVMILILWEKTKSLNENDVKKMKVMRWLWFFRSNWINEIKRCENNETTAMILILAK